MLLQFCSSNGLLQHVCNSGPIFYRLISPLPIEFGAATKLLGTFKLRCACRKALAVLSQASAHLLRQGPGASLQHPAGNQSAPGQPAAAQLLDTGTPAGQTAILSSCACTPAATEPRTVTLCLIPAKRRSCEGLMRWSHNPWRQARLCHRLRLSCKHFGPMQQFGDQLTARMSSRVEPRRLSAWDFVAGNGAFCLALLACGRAKA